MMPLPTPAPSARAALESTRLPESGELIELLLDQGVVTPAQVSYAQRVRAKLRGYRPVVGVLLELGDLATAALSEALSEANPSIRLGSLLVELELLAPTTLAQALTLQRNAPTPTSLREILVCHGLIDEARMNETLSRLYGPRKSTQHVRIDASQAIACLGEDIAALCSEALRAGATDLHLAPLPDGGSVLHARAEGTLLSSSVLDATRTEILIRKLDDRQQRPLPLDAKHEAHIKLYALRTGARPGTHVHVRIAKREALAMETR